MLKLDSDVRTDPSSRPPVQGLGGTSMRGIWRIAFCLIVAANSACASSPGKQTTPQACTNEWFQFVEEQISTGDGQGHGPDLGSLEWRSTVEFKLGIRDDPAVPPPESIQWCSYVNERVIEHTS
jgi:hypothetical protein